MILQIKALSATVVKLIASFSHLIELLMLKRDFYDDR